MGAGQFQTGAHEAEAPGYTVRQPAHVGSSYILKEPQAHDSSHTHPPANAAPGSSAVSDNAGSTADKRRRHDDVSALNDDQVPPLTLNIETTPGPLSEALFSAPFVPERTRLFTPSFNGAGICVFEGNRSQGHAETDDPVVPTSWMFSPIGFDMPELSTEFWDAFTFPPFPAPGSALQEDPMNSPTSTRSSKGIEAECTTQQTPICGAGSEHDSNARGSSSLGPPNPNPILSHTFVSLSKAFQFPEDILYYQFLMDSESGSLSKIIPVLDLVKLDTVAPYFYNAVLALSALSLAKSKEYRHANCKQHAMQHKARAAEGANREFSIVNGERAGDVDGDQVPTPEVLVSWLGTIMLLANFELLRGVEREWQARLRTAGSFLSIYFRALEKRAAGKVLILAYARMSLLLAIYNDDLSVMTTTSLMNPGLVDHLSRVLSESPDPQDRLLPLVQEIGKLEINIRRQPELEDKWSKKLSRLLAALDKWQQDLPATDLPVDTGIPIPTCWDSSVNSVQNQGGVGMVISPLLFPKSLDPCTSAINYATFLCTRMRAKTRFVLGKGRVFPDDAEQTAFTICRIAAGLSPTVCARANLYGQGMLPALYGAYVWTMNGQLREWISNWWSGYRTRREGIWDVEKSRRCLAVTDVILAQRSISESNVIVFKILGELEEEQDDDEVGDGGDGEDATELVEKPFRVVIHSRTPEGWSTDFAVVE